MARKLSTLKPRLSMLDTSIGSKLADSPSSTSSMRLVGRALQRRNRGILNLCPICPICESKGFTTQAAEVDHRLPLIDGGVDEPSNLWALCTPCHVAKTSQEASRRARGELMPLPGLPPIKRVEPRYTIA